MVLKGLISQQGTAAVDSIQNENKLLRESSGIFKVDNDQLQKHVTDSFLEWKAQKNEIDKLKSEIASLKMNSLADDVSEIKGLKVVKQLIDADFKELQKLQLTLQTMTRLMLF